MVNHHVRSPSVYYRQNYQSNWHRKMQSKPALQQDKGKPRGAWRNGRGAIGVDFPESRKFERLSTCPTEYVGGVLYAQPTTPKAHVRISGLITWNAGAESIAPVRRCCRQLFSNHRPKEPAKHGRRRMSDFIEIGTSFTATETKTGAFFDYDSNTEGGAYNDILNFIASQLAEHRDEVAHMSGSSPVPHNDENINIVVRRYRPGQSIGFHTDRVSKLDDMVWSVVVDCGAPNDGLHFEIPTCQASDKESITRENQEGSPNNKNRSESSESKPSSSESAEKLKNPEARRVALEEVPGLVAVQTGAARSEYRHGVTSVTTERISITWRFFRPEYLVTVPGYEAAAASGLRRMRTFADEVAKRSSKFKSISGKAGVPLALSPSPGRAPPPPGIPRHQARFFSPQALTSAQPLKDNQRWHHEPASPGLQLQRRLDYNVAKANLIDHHQQRRATLVPAAAATGSHNRTPVSYASLVTSSAAPISTSTAALSEAPPSPHALDRSTSQQLQIFCPGLLEYEQQEAVAAREAEQQQTSRRFGRGFSLGVICRSFDGAAKKPLYHKLGRAVGNKFNGSDLSLVLFSEAAHSEEGEALIDGIRSAAGEQANSVEPMVVPDEDVDGFLASCDVFVLLEGGIVEHDVAEAVVKQYGSRVLIRVPCTGGAAAKLVVPDNIEMNFERDTLQKANLLKEDHQVHVANAVATLVYEESKAPVAVPSTSVHHLVADLPVAEVMVPIPPSTPQKTAAVADRTTKSDSGSCNSGGGGGGGSGDGEDLMSKPRWGSPTRRGAWFPPKNKHREHAYSFSIGYGHTRG